MPGKHEIISSQCNASLEQIMKQNNAWHEKIKQNSPLKTIRQIKSMLIAKAIADTPKKKPEGEYRSDAFLPAVTYTAHSSYAQSKATASRRRIATAPVEPKQRN